MFLTIYKSMGKQCLIFQYGHLNNILRGFICERYSEEKWNQIVCVLF